MEIQYVDRSSGKLETEKIYGRRVLSLLYGETWASRFFSFFLLPLLSQIPLFSQFYGFLQTRPSSAKKIDPFIKDYRIDRSEFAEDGFDSFNDFFIRKLKPARRPIVGDPHRLAMPADGRYLVFPDLSEADGFYVKGQYFDFSKTPPMRTAMAAGRWRSPVSVRPTIIDSISPATVSLFLRGRSKGRSSQSTPLRSKKGSRFFGKTRE